MITSLSNLNPKVTNVTIRFKVEKINEVYKMTFKDGTVHEVVNMKIFDQTGNTTLRVLDKKIPLFSEGSAYVVDNINSFFQNEGVRATTTENSIVKKIYADIKPEKKEEDSKKYTPTSGRKFEQYKKETGKYKFRKV